MKQNKTPYFKLILFLLLSIISIKELNSQNVTNYKLSKENNKYILIDEKGKNILNKAYDTITKNTSFIKAVNNNTITIYRSQTLEEIKIPHLKQVYFIKDGLEVLTNLGAQYYDNSIAKIYAFPESDNLNCGNVYSKNYRLKFIKKTKKHYLLSSFGDFGSIRKKTAIELKGFGIEKISFLDNTNYISESVNSKHKQYPHLLKVTKDGKSGIYTYNPNNITYLKKKKEKPRYFINKTTGDSILKPTIKSPFSEKKGIITLKEVLPLIYDKIQMNSDNGLVYLYKDNLIGIYTKHNATAFNFFEKRTSSFYKITKNNKDGWLDIKTFKEYYF